MTGISAAGSGTGGIGTGVPASVGIALVVPAARGMVGLGVISGVMVRFWGRVTPDTSDTETRGVAFVAPSFWYAIAKYEKPGVVAR